jgi:hypothetical protein
MLSNTLQINFSINAPNAIFNKSNVNEENKAQVYLKQNYQQNCFFMPQEKTQNVIFISTMNIKDEKIINDNLNIAVQSEINKLESKLSTLEFGKKIKALKIEDLKKIIERIAEEDYNRFVNIKQKCPLQNNRKHSKSRTGVRETKIRFESAKNSTASTGSPEGEGYCEGGDCGGEISSARLASKPSNHHFDYCLLYWGDVLQDQIPVHDVICN